MADTRLHPSELFNLHGKIVIATGGTGGIGLELVTTLAEAGADIISIQLPNDVHATALETRVRGLGRGYQFVEADVGRSEDLRGAFHKLWEMGITPDILLNCAGLNIRGPIEDFTDDMIDKILSVNLKGSYVASQEFAKELLRLERPGKIINMGSMTSYIGMYNVSAYACSKGGVLQMTKAFSNELAGRGVQVNCICPGYITTPLTTYLAQDPKYNDFIMSRTPSGRWGRPQDLRGAVIFLASAASDFVTGSSIIVDGGMLGK